MILSPRWGWFSAVDETHGWRRGLLSFGPPGLGTGGAGGCKASRCRPRAGLETWILKLATQKPRRPSQGDGPAHAGLRGQDLNLGSRPAGPDGIMSLTSLLEAGLGRGRHHPSDALKGFPASGPHQAI